MWKFSLFMTVVVLATTLPFKMIIKQEILGSIVGLSLTLPILALYISNIVWKAGEENYKRYKK